MTFMSGTEYIDSLRKMNPNLYIAGNKITGFTEHPLIKPGINTVAKAYDMTLDPKYSDLFTVQSHMTGELISRFNHIYQDQTDCLQALRMLRVSNATVGTCIMRCVNKEVINPLWETTYQTDQTYGTEYHSRFKEFLLFLQKSDQFCAAGVTDVKGDRGLPPSQQADPDLYVHIVDENKDGITVRGAKMHMTGALASHWIMIIPSTNMSKEDKDYAVAFAVPTDAPGIIHILGRHSMDERRFEGVDLGNADYDMHESLVIFNDVFIPWEKVFMCREYKMTGLLMKLFCGFHRFSYGGCRPGICDVLIGAAKLVSEYNGVPRVSHIRSKLTEMVYLAETMWGCGVAAAVQGSMLPSGSYFPNLMMANVTKLHVGRDIYDIAHMAQEICGGIISTMPSEADFYGKETGELIEKYLKGCQDVPTINRMKIVRLIENITQGVTLPADLFGGGGPQTQKIVIESEANFEYKKNLAKKVAQIND